MPEIAGKNHPLFEEGCRFEIVTLDDFRVKSRAEIIKDIISGINHLSTNILATPDRMKKIRDAFQEGDIIYSYDSNEYEWWALCGCAGIKIVRYTGDEIEVVYNEVMTRS